MDNQVGLKSLKDRGPQEAAAEAARRQLLQVLQEAMGALPEAERVIFVLRDLEDWSLQEIAEQLEEDPDTVRRRLHLARVALQGRLSAHLQGGAAMKLLPSCQDVRDYLTEYAEGALPLRECWALRFHLLRCSACRTCQRGLLALPGLAKSLLAHGPAPAPPEATRALAAAMRRITAQGQKDQAPEVGA